MSKKEDNRNSQKKQMKRGEWLEHFLNPATQVEDYEVGTSKTKKPGFKSLAVDAIKILGVTQKFDLDNDVGLHILDAILSAPAETQQFYPLFDYESYIDKVLHWVDPLRIMSLGKKKATSNELMFFPSIDNIYFDILRDRPKLKKMFQVIMQSGNKQTWEEILPQNQYPTHDYGRLKDSLLYDKKGMWMFVRRFEHNQGFITGGWCLCFPWTIAATTIAFDFLKNDGQVCFTFCKQCGRFTFVKRHPKYFCSDHCRVKYNQEQGKQKT